ncbi:hypothetical protein QL285_056560 [Trifolium repens]|nr:hypothetical protein QL285_056560 [Trifolium repens]
MFVKPKSQTIFNFYLHTKIPNRYSSHTHTHLKSLIDFNFPISRFSQKLETPKNETQQERVQKFDGDLDKDKVERAKLSLPQAMKDHAHGDKEVVQGKIVVIRLLTHHWIWTIRRCIFKVTQAVCETFFNQVSMKKMKMKMMMQLGGC